MPEQAKLPVCIVEILAVEKDLADKITNDTADP